MAVTGLLMLRFHSHSVCCRLILVGFAAFILTIPLAATSNRYMIKRLKTNWKKLHQSIYLIAILVVLHYLLLVKKDVTEPLYYAVALVLLLGIRVYFKYKPKLSKTAS